MRWALLLAIDIAEYEGIAVDGAGAMSPVHIPSLGSYPEDFIAPMQDWLKEFTLDIGNGETFKPLRSGSAAARGRIRQGPRLYLPR